MDLTIIPHRQQYIEVPAGRHVIRGLFTLPIGARGVVVFAHGSGSSRHSLRNQFVARVLEEAGLGTLLVDLLEEMEAVDRTSVFDIGLLGDRVLAVIDWTNANSLTNDLPLGLFGASTGAAAALVAAAERPERVSAVVSRGGRPDLAESALPRVHAPTLLIVGGADPHVLALNEKALARLRCHAELTVVAGATHLFAEPGALEEVARLANEWFGYYLLGPAASRHHPGEHVLQV
jgi:putative phosphoribosyl transferase